MIPVSYAQIQPAGWRFVSAAQLAHWLDQGKPLQMLDVRGRQTYLNGAIPGSLNAGVDPYGFLPDNSGELLVLVTTNAADSAFIGRWFERLAAAGHPVVVLEGGFDAWVRKGLQTERPEAVFTRPGTVPFRIPRGLCEGGEPAQIFE